MSDINGGSLKYSTELDLSGLQKGLVEGERGLKGFTSVAQEAGQKLDDAFSTTKENLKIQKQVILELEKQYKELQNTIDTIAPGKAQAQLMGEAAGIAKEIALEKQALVELEAQVSTTSEKHATLRTRLEAVKNEMAEMAATGDTESEKYQKLAQDADIYGKAIKEVSASVKVLGSNTGLTAFVNGVGFASGVLSTSQGIMALFVGENENLDRIMVNLQATMSAAIGIQQIQNSLQKESGVIQSVVAIQAIARAKAEALATRGTIGATIAQKAFNLVAKAHPYVLIATALLSVVGAMILFSGKTKKAAEEQKKLDQTTADGAATQIASYKKLQFQYNALGDDLKSKKKFITENKDEFHELGVEVNNTADAEKFFVSQSDSFIKSLMLRAEAAANAQIAVEKYKEAIINDKEIESFDKDWSKSNVFGKVALSAKAIITNVDDTKGQTSRNEGDEAIKKQAELLKKADELREKAAKAYSGPDTKQNTPKSAKSTADEFLPPGSVAEIQKRMAAIDTALSKSTNSDNISALKSKRITTAKELAIAEKKIQILTLQEQFDESNTLWSQYYSTVTSLNEEKAKSIYGDLLKNNKSQFDSLLKTKTDLSGKVNFTDEEKEVLQEVNRIIDEMLGKQSKLDQFKSSLADSLSGKSILEQLDYLEKTQSKMTSGDKDQGFFAVTEEKKREVITQQKELFQSVLTEQQSYEEKSLALQKKYSTIKESDLYKNSSDTDRKKIDDSFTKDQGVLDMDFIQKSKEWEVAFSDLEGMSNFSLQRVLQALLNFKEKSKGTLSISDSAELEKAIERVKAASDKNPFHKITKSFSDYFTSINKTKSAQEKYTDAVAEFGENSKEAKFASDELIEADKKQLEAKKKLYGKIQEGQDIFNAVGEGVMGLESVFGGFDDATNDAIGNIMDIGNAAFDLGKSIASGDVAGMISAGLQLIGSIGKALNGDQKKERQIKKQAALVKELETAYNNLSYAADKAFGSGKYDAQKDLVKNLEQQKAILQGMLQTESTKKKADKDKLADYKNQIQTINQSIDEIKTKIVEDVLQTSVQDAAAQMGDALVENFGRGKDAIDAVDKAANNMIKNLLKNQLNLLLENKMQPILDDLLKAAGFNADGTGTFTSLSADKIAEFKRQVAQSGQDMQGFLDTYSDILGDYGANTTNSLSGAVSTVTQETASIIAGYLNAIRILVSESYSINNASNDLLRSILVNIIQIEINTRNIAKDIAEINTKMKSNLAGLG